MEQSAKISFDQRFHAFLQSNVCLKDRVWFKTGGNADFLFRVPDITELQAFLHYCSLPVVPLGVGSNVIVRDGGIKGVVIRLGKNFKDITVDGHTVVCGAAALDKTVAQQCLAQSLGGVEFLYGIPGTIGGAVRMNAGAYGTEIKDVLQWADVIDRKGNVRRLLNEDLRFSYRKSQLEPDWIITRAALRVFPKDPVHIQQEMNTIQEKRLKSQPGSRTGGSTFANPVGEVTRGDHPDENVELLKAWQLIDGAGCRGLRKGDAQVSTLHCNFLLNTGNASAADLEDLGEEVRQRVYKRWGILLEWEIDRLGIR